MNRRQIAIALSVLPLAGLPTAALAQGEQALRVAIEGSQRTAKNRARDPWRHPGPVLEFWGLAPGMTVVEIDPAGGYWTEILAPYLRATGGRYVAAVSPKDLPTFRTRYADPAIFGHIEVAAFSPDTGLDVPPASADLLITARNIHDWLTPPERLDRALGAFHAALKPGATLGVTDHRADPRPMVPGAADGYVSTAFVTEAVEKAGFRLVAASQINANPRDTKDYPFGVWTLPPTLRDHARDQPTPTGYDAAKYRAIGESDRMTLRFRRT